MDTQSFVFLSSILLWQQLCEVALSERDRERLAHGHPTKFPEKTEVHTWVLLDLNLTMLSLPIPFDNQHILSVAVTLLTLRVDSSYRTNSGAESHIVSHLLNLDLEIFCGEEKGTVSQ